MIHGIPSEVIIGVEEGLRGQSAINLDNVQSVERSKLTHYVGIARCLENGDGVPRAGGRGGMQ